MTLSDLASIGSFVSGLAVLVGLISLTIQIRHNTAQLVRNELNAAQQQFAGFRYAIVNHRDVAELWMKGAKDEPLDEVDAERFTTLLIDLCWSVFNVWERHGRGIGMNVPGAIPFLARALQSRCAMEAWRSVGVFFPPDFIQSVNAYAAGLRETAPELPPGSH
jgi:hypothetical protein